MGTTIRRTHLAAFLIGGVMGVIAEMAAGLILYEGSGLLRATTVVLTTEAAAAGAGLLFATRVPADEISGHLRRHLHLTLVSLGLAGILTSLWGYFGGLSDVWNGGGQAAALALLAALPLYTAGSVLGLMCRAGSRDAEGGTVAGGGPALLGAATGFLIYGLFLVPRLDPPVLVLLCMAAVSGAALLVGSAVTRAADLAHREQDGVDPDAAAGEEDAAVPEAVQMSHEPDASTEPMARRIGGTGDTRSREDAGPTSTTRTSGKPGVMTETRDGRHGRCTGNTRALAFALLAAIALAACAPQGGGGRLNVRTLEVRATSADSMVFEGAAVDSTWTIPGDDARRLTRSLVLEPGDQSETPNPLVDVALRALVTGYQFLPPGELPDDIESTEDTANGLLEISLQQGINFRAIVVTNYNRGEDLAWRGQASFGDRMVWIDSRVLPADTVRLALDGDYEDVRDGAGGQQAVLRAQGTLSVATAGEYAVELTERVEIMEVSAEGVARMMDGVRADREP